jgi:RhtB (resistance to homoserine/threonine) family protein
MTGAEIFTVWLMIVAINTAATMSPGPAFAMIVRSAMAYNRRVALLTAFGFGAGVMIVVFLVLFGFATILSQSALLFNTVKYLGAAYLFYIGCKALMAKKQSIPATDNTAQAQHKSMSDGQAFRMGLVTNLLNPKGIVFFTAIYAQFVAPGTPWQVLILYGLTSATIETLWFSMVAAVLTDSRVKGRFLRVSHWIERLCGGLLLALGIRLALFKA